MNYRKWDIWRANLDPVVGSEQGKSRPVLIISEDDVNNLLNVVNIIPITSRKDGRTIYPNEVLIPSSSFGLEKESITLCHQIRTIDKKRLSKQYGHVSDKTIQKEIIEAVKFQLGII
ncbi:MAG: type II toxin-antitoxin system PemK/MazF family toxin [Draconibacterium sp.]|jgi:mRNA interferase MazF|nr:type II toxin-antitoxin system PemK/MazF family toxin [Draconibacterium sp.]